ncbi:MULTISPECIES: cation diffusion facilitator family transporter [unclassified Methanobrevibacter]|jgi:cation diffusion facilitator family transporter|uniref:cation diffusion facilitator family transporter n=1 Tax=unclassified Methanobrevibacter TaxID=2638681 RepID=UPI0039B92999
MANILRHKEGRKAVFIAIIGNVFLTIFNILVGVNSGSFALITEGAHTLSDVATSIIAFLGFEVGQKPADAEHPLGHGRAEAISGLVIVIFLCLVSFEILRSAIIKLFFGGEITTPTLLAAGMAIVGLIINLLISHQIIKIGTSINSPAIVADGHHQRTDLFNSLAILIGVIVANLGYPIIDPVVGLIIGVIILYTAFKVGRDNINNIMGKVPSEELIQEIHDTAESVPGVYGVHDIRVNYLGAYATATLHVSLDPDLSLNEAHKIAHLVQNKVDDKVDLIEGVTCHTCPLGLEYDHEQPIDE